MSKQLANDEIEADTLSVTLPGTIEKIIPSAYPGEPEKAQISIEGADQLYREVRVGVKPSCYSGGQNTFHFRGGLEQATRLGRDSSRH
jgi:hypothetical protein